MTPSSTSRPAADFSGLWIPLVTPFDPQGAVDHPALARLVRHLAAQEVRGFVVCGSTGEAAALEREEQHAVLRTVLTAADDKPVIMGLSGYHLPHTLAWVRALAAYPLHGLLVPAPHYLRPAQAGLLIWFERIADAAAAPVVLYDVPARTGVALATPTLLALAAHPNIHALKDCGGDAAKTQALIDDGRLQLLAGNDDEMLATLAAGGAGAIAMSAHVCTAGFAHLVQALRAGRLDDARRRWPALRQVVRAAFAEPNPGVMKAALAEQGWLHNHLREPMTPASDSATRALLDAIKNAAPSAQWPSVARLTD